MVDLDLAVIGNGSFGALIDRRGRIVWSCLPRFDGDPVFCSLLQNHSEPENGFFDIELLDLAHCEQAYRHNSAVLETVLHDNHGGVVRVTDFIPRFKQFGRIFRPLTIVRRIEPLKGAPRIRIRLRPTYEYGSRVPERTRGSNHVRFVIPDMTLRLTTDAPISYVMEERPFVLERPMALVLGADESLTAAVPDVARDFQEGTDDYWLEWCRFLALPFEWQDAVIRAAITLKLCSFDESGAIIAAMTTSVPEAPGSNRNWDYRYCWLRDSYFVVHALNRLGVTRTMESYLSYIVNIVAAAEGGHLQPVYGITLESRLDEREISTLRGYRGMGPVRVGNHAYSQIQNDGYGAVVLASAQSFFDKRLSWQGDIDFFRRLERLGEQSIALWDKPDSGLWELRSRAAVHTFSSIMCWAACDRLARIAVHLGETERAAFWAAHAKDIRNEILEHAWNDQLNSLAATFGGEDMDASLLLLPELGFLKADDPRFRGTFARIEGDLRRGDHVFRYAAPDDFGSPETAFNVCTFWYIDALAEVGRRDEARELFENMLRCRNSVGLLSEDFDSAKGELWGNFPQTYSMVGLINSAMRLSKPWEEAF
jgi:GH15 family glucan-1,4-alpha-glucosidase